MPHRGKSLVEINYKHFCVPSGALPFGPYLTARYLISLIFLQSVCPDAAFLNIMAYIIKPNHKQILQYQHPIQIKEIIIFVLFPFGAEDEPAG